MTRKPTKFHAESAKAGVSFWLSAWNATGCRIFRKLRVGIPDFRGRVLAAVKEWDTLADQKGPVRHELMAVRCRPARKVDRVFQAVSS